MNMELGDLRGMRLGGGYFLVLVSIETNRK